VRQNETSQTQRVVGRLPEQPSPKCCSPKNLLLEFQDVNGTYGPVKVSLFGMPLNVFTVVLRQSAVPLFAM